MVAIFKVALYNYTKKAVKSFLKEVRNLKQVGKITNYLDQIGVAVLEVTDGQVKEGDRLLIGEEGEGVEQIVASMQIDHNAVETVDAGQACGLKVDKEVKAGDNVYLLEG